MISRSYRPATILRYHHRVKMFATFLDDIHVSRNMPIPTYYVGLYVAKLFKEGLAPATIRLALSAIGWFHRMSNAPDPTLAPAIQRMIMGAKRAAPPPKKLDPITRPLLHIMVTKVDSLPSSDFQRRLTKALLLLGYHACARVGELVVSGNADHTLKMENLSIRQVRGNTGIHFELESYKHSKGKIEFELLPGDDPVLCLVRHLISYLELRGTGPGCLFLNATRAPVRREFLANQIQMLAGLLGLAKEKFNTHSLRIGRTTDMAAERESEANIKRTGRWNSPAYLGYVRFASFVLPK